MAAGYWFVQTYRIGGHLGAEEVCKNGEEAAAKVITFKDTNSDPLAKIRIHVPSGTGDHERRIIDELGVESI